MKSAGFKPPIYGIRAITVCKSGLLTTCYNWDDPPSSDIPGSYPNVTHEGAELQPRFLQPQPPTRNLDAPQVRSVCLVDVPPFCSQPTPTHNVPAPPAGNKGLIKPY